jgi:DNA primase
MPGVDFDRLRAEVPMRQVLQLLGFEASRYRGDQWTGQCPLPACRQSHRATFSVNVALGRYYCHRCHSHGHQLELWAAATGLTLYPAAIDLCAALGRDVPWQQRRPSARTR